jgi:hypothetical protein
MTKKALQSIAKAAGPQLRAVTPRRESHSINTDALLLGHLCEAVAAGDTIAGLESLDTLSRTARARLVEFLHQQALLLEQVAQSTPGAIEHPTHSHRLH